MSENLRNYTKAAYTLDAVVRRVPDDAWDRQSPCEDWTAREVLGHVIWGTRNLVALASGGERPPEQAEADVAGAHPGATWRSACDDAMAALDQPGALQRVGPGPFGEMAVDGFLGFIPSDLLAHAWDIATAAGIDAHLPADLCERGAAGLAAAGDLLRGPGLMAAPVEVPADADAATRFIALSGRRPAAASTG